MKVVIPDTVREHRERKADVKELTMKRCKRCKQLDSELLDGICGTCVVAMRDE